MRGKGKTTLARSVLDTEDRHMVYDCTEDYGGYRRYVPERRTDTMEYNAFVRDLVLEHKPRLVVMDEAPLYIPNRKPLPAPVMTMVGLSRHLGMSVGWVAHRPAQLHPHIVELADYLMVYRLNGANDMKRLDAINEGLADVVRGLPDWHFALYHDGETSVHAPVDLTN